jgi:predicted nucleic acid-binding protein
MAWLLDTNILSELRKAKPDPKVVAFVSGPSVKEHAQSKRFRQDASADFQSVGRVNAR